MGGGGGGVGRVPGRRRTPSPVNGVSTSRAVRTQEGLIRKNIREKLFLSLNEFPRYHLQHRRGILVTGHVLANMGLDRE